MRPDALRGAVVVVAGAGISGLAAARALLDLGARVTVTDARPEALTDLPDGAVAGSEDALPAGTALVVTGPGRRPDHPLVRSGVPVVGETELAWWLGSARPEPPAWLVATGTNGKTTTTGMLAAILRASDLDAVACGNIGYPAVDAVRAGHPVLAVELSSFQLHWSPSIVPAAGCVLNVAEDHLDWHGSMDAYAAAKARALRGPVAVAGVDDGRAAALLAAAPAPRRVGVTLGEPRAGQLGVVDGTLVDRAFSDGVELAPDQSGPPGDCAGRP
ncbi:Mur ligase family protein [Pseudonocardia hydrocarbonoxydans]|uniref:Mur ligase family protein n=1 Tax=Pseudonocardia hydrocarbonoxydans TaxID=76726 RepID=UPI0031E0035D